MAKLTVEGIGEFVVDDAKRLATALREVGTDQLHACGGKARCTTCRVEFIEGEPTNMTLAEKTILADRGVTGSRLSCQILCDHDMKVRLIRKGAVEKTAALRWLRQLNRHPSNGSKSKWFCKAIHRKGTRNHGPIAPIACDLEDAEG